MNAHSPLLVETALPTNEKSCEFSPLLGPKVETKCSGNQRSLVDPELVHHSFLVPVTS